MINGSCVVCCAGNGILCVLCMMCCVIVAGCYMFVCMCYGVCVGCACCAWCDVYNMVYAM